MALAYLLLATNVSFSGPAARIENLLPDLGVALKRKLEAAPECRNEVLLIDVKDVDADLLLKKVAAAADAQWQTKPDGTLILTRPPEMVSKERNRILAERTAELQRLQSDLRAKTDALPAFDPKEAQTILEGMQKPDGQPSFTPFRGGVPGNRLAARILSRLPANVLATMREGDRMVFATRPTPWQRALPGGLEKDLAQFAKDQDVWAATASGTDPGSGPMPMEHPVLSSTVGRPPFSLQVKVTHYSDLSPASADVIVSDRTGKPFLRTNALLVTKGIEKYTAPRAAGEPWNLPAEGAAWGRATDLNYRGGTQLPPRGLIEKATQPDKYEPLSFVIGPSLAESARRRGHGIVANIPDILLGSLEVHDGKVDLNALERQLVLHDVRHDDAGPIELVASDDPLNDRSDRVDRHALAALARALRLTGMARLDDLAAYAAATPAVVRGWDGLSFYTIRILLPRAERIAQMTDARTMRFYGMLSPAQRQSLRGGRLNAVALSPGARSALQDLMLNGDLRPATTPQNAGPFGADVAFEPTRILPASGVLNFAVTGQSTVNSGLIAGSPEHNEYAAWTHILTAYPNRPMAVMEGSELWPGKVENLSLEFTLNGINWQTSLQDCRVRLDTPPTSPDRLPDGLQITFRPFDP